MRNARCVAWGPPADAGLRKRKTEAFQEPALSEAGGTRGPGLASPCPAPARGALPLSLPLSAALAAGGSRVFPPGGGGLKYDKGGAVRTAPCGPNPVALAQT